MTTTRHIAIAVISAISALAFVADATEPIVVRTSSELLDALTDANTGQQIRLMAGNYTIDRPLRVPDNTTLVGAGVMLFDADGIPSGFAPGTAPIIEVASGFTGNLLTLGNGSAIHGVALRDLASVQRVGNVVIVESRAPKEVVIASIDECEIFEPNGVGFSDEGPTGRGVIIMTHNWVGPSARPPDEGATVNVSIERSVVHTHGSGDAVFAINFASHGRVRTKLSHNRLEGMLQAAGGTNRLHPLTHAETTIESEHNLFISENSTANTQGWLLIGASSPPHFSNVEFTPLRFTSLRFHSVDDRIEGFPVGIRAAAARRVLPATGPVSDSVLDIDISGLRMKTVGADAADLKLYATLSAPTTDASRGFDVGDRNTLRIRIEGSTGSGVRANTYALHAGTTLPANHDTGNRIEIAGDADTFARSNKNFEPAPPAEYFSDHGIRTATGM